MGLPSQHLTQDVSLKRPDDQSVAGQVIAATLEHLTIHDETWRPVLRSMKALDAEWDWRADFLSLELQRPDRETYALVASGVLHGLMSIELQQERVYVERLAVAPSDRDAATRLKGCGAALVLVAIKRADQLGHQGRVWLHSLEDESTIGFYATKLKMLETGLDTVDGQLLRRFELSTERAQELLGGTS